MGFKEDVKSMEDAEWGTNRIVRNELIKIENEN